MSEVWSAPAAEAVITATLTRIGDAYYAGDCFDRPNLLHPRARQAMDACEQPFRAEDLPGLQQALADWEATLRQLAPALNWGPKP